MGASQVTTTNTFFEYDGSSWTAGGDMSNIRDVHGNSQNGTQTAASAFGGRNTPASSVLNKTEAYDGTSWSEQATMGTARSGLHGAGTLGSGLAFGGNPPHGALTEEYTHIGTATIKTVTTS